MRAFLRTLRGQAALFGGTTVGAVLFAVFLVTQTAFFEGYVREKPEATAAHEVLAERLATEPVRLTEDDREGVYAAWMLGAEPTAGAVENLGAAWFLTRAERTMLAGTPEQRARARAMVEATRPADAEALLVRLRPIVARTGPEEAIEALD